MVAISLYRGNLHKVPDVPRKWLVPNPKISRKDFKILLHRRARALSRLRLSDPNPIPPGGTLQVQITNCHDETGPPNAAPELPELKVCDVKVDNLSEGEKLVEQTDAAVDDKREEHVVAEVNAVLKDDGVVPMSSSEVVVEAKEKARGVTGNPSSPQILTIPVEKKGEVQSEKEKRRREIEAKLQILNEKKHSLVQILKQILSAEEELKRRSSVQGMVVGAPVALQVDTAHDPGSGSRLNTPRMGSEGNVANEVGGGETDVNHIAQSRHSHRTSSTSPSSDSQQKRLAFSTVPLVSRANSGVANSPSRFTLSGQQGRPSSLPTVSMSGTNYIASSPSPAASGATSAFRDGRIPSPWN